MVACRAGAREAGRRGIQGPGAQVCDLGAMGPCPPGGQGGGQARALLQRVRGGLPRACEPRGGPRRQVGRWRRRQGDISRTGGLLLGAPPVHPQAERGQGAKDHCEWHDRPRLERQLGLALLAPEAQAHLHPEPGDRPDDQEVYRPQGLKAQDLGGGVDLGRQTGAGIGTPAPSR